MKSLLPFLFASALFAQTPVATPTVGTWYHLQNKAGLCLSAQASTARTQVCSATDPAQSFLMSALAGGYGFVAQSTGLVLDVFGAGLSNGIPLDAALYNGGTNQIFALTSAGPGYFYLKPTHDNLCLETTVANAAAPSSPVVQWTCLSGTNQQWQFVTYGPIPAGAVSIVLNPLPIAATATDPGVIDGTNQVFTLPVAPIAGSVRAYLNGVRIPPGDVTLSGLSITLGFAPQSGDHILIDYLHN